MTALLQGVAQSYHVLDEKLLLSISFELIIFHFH